MQTLVKIFAAFIFAHLTAISTPATTDNSKAKLKPDNKKEKKIGCSESAKELKVYQKLS